MEYRDILSRRRMHRAFLPDPLPREQIDRIAAPIRHAPSAGFGFSQGGSIVVVTRDETREAIARAFGDEHGGLAAQVAAAPAGRPRPPGAMVTLG
jgi:nitroreductase